MKYVICCLTSALVCVFYPSLSFAAENSCECPKLACDPCSFEKGVTFYTEKCGPEDSKLKSCGRPTCIPIDEATKECPNPPRADAGPRQPIVVGGSASVPVVSGEEKAELQSIGKVKVISGSVSIVRPDGKRVLVAKEESLHEGETVESGKESGAVVELNGGNRVDVHQDTAVQVKEYKNPSDDASRKALLNLIKGRIRNQVEQKYNGKTSYYRVETKTAVAGVRGTIFVIEQKENGETDLETLRGRVAFSSLDGQQTEEVGRGEGARLLGGKLGPVFRMNDQDMKDLERDSVVATHKYSKTDVAICDKPKGGFNQCLWKCMNNPAGEKRCRTDLPSVSCVRERCNGNGEWADETQLSRSMSSIACPGTGIVVRNCDY